MLTPEEIEIAKFGKEQGKTREEVLGALSKYRASKLSVKTEEPKRNFLKETAGDVTETVLGVGKQVGDIYNKSMDIVEDRDYTVPQKAMGVLGKFTSGISGAIGELVTGAGKAVLSQESEDKLKKLTQNAGQGIAKTDVAKSVIDWYGSLNKSDKLFVDSAGGVASFIADVYAPGLAKTATKPVVSGTKTAITTGKEAIQTGVEAIKPAVTKTSNVVSGATDVAKGLGTQVTDFGKRVVSGAQGTAEQSRKLATLPVPEAKLIRSGVDDAAVKLIKESSSTEKGIYKSLVEKAKTKTDDLLAEEPKVVVGQEFMKPVSHLIKVRNSVGAKLGEVRKKLSNAPLDVTPQWNEFKKYLDGRGIVVDKNGKFIKGRGNMAPSDLAELQKMYNELRPNNAGKVIRSQKWIDEWSQRTYKEYDMRQAREKTFSDDVTRTVEQARNAFKKALPTEYQTYSRQYSEAMKPIEDVVKLLGYKGDITKLSSKEIKAAEVALRVIGGASDRPQSVIDAVLGTAKKYGYTSDVDLKKVIIFADALEDVYPNITPKRGFTGSTARGVNQSGLGVAGDIATGNVKGLLGQAMGSSATQKEIQDALDAFLKSLE